MKELKLEKEITLNQIKQHWFELEDPYVTDNNEAIDFSMPCSDWFAVFSGQFKDIKSFLKWCKYGDCRYMDSNLVYYPASKQLLMVFTFVEQEHTYSYITIKDGPGKDKLIQMCEECCKNECDQTCDEFLADV